MGPVGDFLDMCLLFVVFKPLFFSIVFSTLCQFLHSRNASEMIFEISLKKLKHLNVNSMVVSGSPKRW